MEISEMKDTIQEAERLIKKTDSVVGDMAQIIASKLRNGNVYGYVLCRLKKELRDYNMHTGYWKGDE